MVARRSPGGRRWSQNLALMVARWSPGGRRWSQFSLLVFGEARQIPSTNKETHRSDSVSLRCFRYWVDFAAKLVTRPPGSFRDCEFLCEHAQNMASAPGISNKWLVEAIFARNGAAETPRAFAECSARFAQRSSEISLSTRPVCFAPLG